MPGDALGLPRPVAGPAAAAVAAPSRRWHPALVFMLLGGLNAMLLAVLTPPFQVHDEFQHFFRSYQLSEGKLFGTVAGGRAGGELPTSLPAFVLTSWGTLGIWTSPPLRPRPWAETATEFSRPLAPLERGFADFSGAVGYSPLPYIPQAAAIAVGRWFELSPLTLMLLGRLANALVAVAVIAWALRILPVGREAALVVALLPMAQYEYGSVAPDAGLIAAAFLFIGLALRAGLRGRWRAGEAVTAALAGAVFCSIKIVYAPLLCCALPAILRHTRRDSGGTGRFLLATAAIIAASVVASLLWLKSVSGLMEAVLVGNDAQIRMHEITAQPFGQLVMVARDLVHHGAFYLQDFVGIFGVTNIPMPGYAYAVPAVAVVLALIAARDDTKLGWVWIFWNLLIVASAVAAVETALSIIATPPGSWLIWGVQGRYFLPIAPLGAVVVTGLLGRIAPQRRPTMAYAGTIVALVLGTVLMDVTLLQHFQLF
ncbi:MAG: DUF2142 domain-containing protein [Acetobacteraceae bacterium]